MDVKLHVKIILLVVELIANLNLFNCVTLTLEGFYINALKGFYINLVI